MNKRRVCLQKLAQIACLIASYSQNRKLLLVWLPFIAQRGSMMVCCSRKPTKLASRMYLEGVQTHSLYNLRNGLSLHVSPVAIYVVTYRTLARLRLMLVKLGLFHDCIVQ